MDRHFDKISEFLFIVFSLLLRGKNGGEACMLPLSQPRGKTDEIIEAVVLVTETDAMKKRNW